MRHADGIVALCVMCVVVCVVSYASLMVCAESNVCARGVTTVRVLLAHIALGADVLFNQAR